LVSTKDAKASNFNMLSVLMNRPRFVTTPSLRDEVVTKRGLYRDMK